MVRTLLRSFGIPYNVILVLRSSMGFMEYVRLARLLFVNPFRCLFASGVFLCIRCSGIHRGMGTHISRVKSVDLDIWTPEQMEVRSIRCIQCHPDFSRQSIQLWGNKRANLYWEAHLKSGHIPPEQ